jgi:RNA polymerase sigma-70 factor (ECF subfamily)
VVRNRALKVRLAGLRETAVEDKVLLGIFDGGADPTSRLPETCALRRGLERLDSKRRASLILAYVDGCTHDEIAEQLGVPIGTAKAWIRRSLITLRAELD